MGWFLFTILTLFWSGSFIAIRFAIADIPPFAAAGLRILFGTLFLFTYAYAKRVPFPKSWRKFRIMALLGLLNFAIPWLCLFWGEQFILPALASIINSTVPLFVLVFSWLLLPGERITKAKLIGVVLGFFGIVTIFLPESLHPLEGKSLYGMLAVLTMALSYGLGTVGFKMTSVAIDYRWSSTIQGAVAALVVFVVSFFFEDWGWIATLPNHPRAMWSILYLSLFSTAIGWLIYYWLIEAWGTVKASTVTLCVPLAALIIDWFYFHKLPAANQLAGAALIISGLIILHSSRKKEQKT